MKNLNEFLINKPLKKYNKYNYFPKTNEDLRKIIEKRIRIEGLECDLNDIDVSEITDMSYLFCDEYETCDFNGDISK